MSQLSIGRTVSHATFKRVFSLAYRSLQKCTPTHTATYRHVHTHPHKPHHVRAIPHTAVVSRTYSDTSTHPQRAYDSKAIEQKWQERWALQASKAEGQKVIADLSDNADVRYSLTMFPYPSGSLHMGHVRVYTMSDCMTRFYRLRGEKVVHPMGWDAFGLPAENAAIDRGLSPAEWTKTNIEQMKVQMTSMGFDFDWDREIATCDPDYYKWTQWIFVKMFERNLAYQKAALVNWDPVDMTVLANEQVGSDGTSWRSGAMVEKKKMTQWFLRITDYAQELLDGLKDLNWPSQVKAMQTHWIGRSEGVTMNFPLVRADGSPLTSALGEAVSIAIFTTKVETVFGASFLALAPEHEMVKASCDLVSAESDSAREKRRTTVEQYVHKVANMSSTTRQAEGGSSTGLDLQLYALNPFNGKRIPVYACDYVLSDYGTGAVMGVPAHDSRDALFAQNHNLEVVPVYSGTDLGAAGSSGSIGGGDSDGRDNVGSQADGSGSEGAAEDTDSVVLVESGEFSGMPVALGRAAIAAKALDMGIGETTTQYKIRDWGVSRQRYWGAPIPIVHCKSCKAVAVPESDLPVRLPETVTLSGRGGSPLETAKDWLHTTCPKCHGPAVRDTNTMDTFVDSSWYFLRYLDPNNTEALAGAAAVKGMPVDLYIGGIEHAIMHLLYSRFVTKFLRDEGVIPNCSEPFTELLNQGMVHGRTFTHPTTGQYLKPDEVDLSDPLKPLIRESGLVPTDSFEKMSKSKYNGVDPSAASEQHGVDTLRLHMLFKAPPELVLDWDTQSIQGSRRWLVRVWGLVQELLECRILTDDGYKGSDIDIESRRMLHRTVQSVETALETHSFNSAVAKLMGFTNEIRQHRDRGMSSILLHDCIEMLAVLSYPMVPHIASEIWEVVTHRPTSAMRWPVVDHKLLATAERTVVIQINGRTKGTVTVDSNATDAQVQEAALASDVVKKQQLDMDSIRRMIVANKGGLINLVMPKKK